VSSLPVKLGLLSDIHSHAPALQNALDLLEKQGVDRLLCLGDMVQEGKDALPVLRLIRQYDVLAVFGNHEQEMLNYQQTLPPQHPHRLSDDHIRYLTELPFSRYLSYSGQTVYMTHAAPWSENKGLFYRHPQGYRRAIQHTGADIVLVGHTHLAGHVQVSAAHVYNPGAVWDSIHEEMRTCATLTLPDGLFEVFSLVTRTRMMFSLSYSD